MAENTNTLREALNNVVVEGLLLEVRHQEWKSGKGLNIEIDIETGEGEVHTVHGMSKYKKDDGSDNGIAKGYQTIINEYCSVAKVGREEAHKVRVTQGRIGINEYYGQDGQLKSFPQLSSNFFNRVEVSDEYNPKAEFEVEVIIQNILDEVNKDGEDTGRAKVKAFIPLYGGKVIPFEFVVTPEGSDYVKDNYEKGQTVKVYGDIVNRKEVTVIEEQVDFGKPQKKTKTKTIREYVITGANGYEEDDAKSYNLEIIKKALTEREVYLEGLKNQKKETKKEESKKDFDTKSTEKKPNIKIDDLPF